MPNIQSSSSVNSNIVNFNDIKQKHINKQHLEIIMRDSMDNIEEYSFQMYYASNMDMIGEFEILPCYDYSQANNIKARA